MGDGSDYACPRPSDVIIDLARTVDEANPDEHAMREYTDDQAIHVGYAIGTPETQWLQWSSISRCCYATNCRR